MLFYVFSSIVENKHNYSSLAFRFSTLPEDVYLHVILDPKNMNMNLLLMHFQVTINCLNSLPWYSPPNSAKAVPKSSIYLTVSVC